jgi:hypothetical protein
MDIDAEFGAALIPSSGTRQGEESYHPRSLAVISLPSDEVALPDVVSYMAAVHRRCSITGYLCECATIIWLVDESGELRMAIEEAFRDEPHFETIPIPRIDGKPPSGWRKLGHPSLVQKPDKRARIAGEIRYFNNNWQLNNYSGRYGLSSYGRTRIHLENVAKRLRLYGLTIEVEFL